MNTSNNDVPEHLAGQPVTTIIYKSLCLWMRSLLRTCPLSLILTLAATLVLFECTDLQSYSIGIGLHYVPENWHVLIAYWILALLFLPTMFHQLYSQQHTKSASLMDSFTLSVKRLPYTIIVSVIMMVTCTIGLTLFIIPGIILIVILQFYLPLVVIEDEGVFSSFKKCCDLVWGNWWRTAFILMVPNFIIIFIAYFIENTINAYLMLHHPSWLTYYDTIFNVIYSTLFLPLALSLVIVQLNDLKKRAQNPRSNIDKAIDYLSQAW